MAEKTGLVWFRSGLRLQDNTALYHALLENDAVYCLFVLDDHYLRSGDIGAARVAFLLACLRSLNDSLQAAGGDLILRYHNDIPSEVLRVANSVGATRIYLNEDYLPYPMARDKRLAELAKPVGVQVQTYTDIVLVHPSKALTLEGKPYSVFTPFKRRWESLLATPQRYEVSPLLHRLRKSSVDSAPFPTLDTFGLALHQQIEAGSETRAYARLEEFAAKGLATYHERRDFAADPNSTSRLSMHLKWGTVSIRDAYRTARKIGGVGADKWIDELAWREFYHAVAFHFPHALSGAMLPEYDAFPWVENEEHLEAWKAGQTGYPFVDAGMRQLNATGWMHNRLRQVVASYLCKDLGIHWQSGERYFMQMLTDGDWASNNGGWQWVAGTGTDPRRATRIFNPTLQMERYDPKAEYVRQWIPEYGTSRYPTPVVLHEIGRRNFLERFQQTSDARKQHRNLSLEL